MDERVRVPVQELDDVAFDGDGLILEVGCGKRVMRGGRRPDQTEARAE